MWGQGAKPRLHPLCPSGPATWCKGFATHHQRLAGILGFALPRGPGISKGDIPS